MQPNSVHHHIHKRKRIHLKKQTYPHPDKYIHILDDTCLIFAFIMPLTTIPQVYNIYWLKQVEGVSLVMWVAYTIGVVPFLLYGLAHKEKPLIVSNSLWLIMQTVIVVGLLTH